MPQIFPKGLNPVARMVLIALPIVAGSTGIGLAAFYRSSYATGIGEEVPQPVAFSHKHHAGELGIHCAYCHTSVETSHFAGIPPTQTCMNCHQQMWTGADLLEPVRKSWKENSPIAWNRVHNVPHYAYFNHSIHVAKGVGCVSCHGQIDQMNLVYQSKTLLMEWCIACHREPEKNLRPRSEVYSMTWSPKAGEKWKLSDFGGYETGADGKPNPIFGDPDFYDAEKKQFKDRPTDQIALGELLKKQYHVRDKVTLTNCSMCHR